MKSGIVAQSADLKANLKLKKDEVISGFRVKVISKRIEKYWLPSQFQMELQSKDIQDKIFIRVYNFRNIRINRDIQVINRGT